MQACESYGLAYYLHRDSNGLECWPGCNLHPWNKKDVELLIDHQIINEERGNELLDIQKTARKEHVVQLLGKNLSEKLYKPKITKYRPSGWVQALGVLDKNNYLGRWVMFSFLFVYIDAL